MEGSRRKIEERGREADEDGASEREADKKRCRQKERERAREKDGQVGRRDFLQKDTRGQRGIRPTGRATRVRNEQRKRLISTCYLEETAAQSSSIVLG